MKASLRKWVLLVSGMAVLLFVMAIAAGTAKATGDDQGEDQLVFDLSSFPNGYCLSGNDLILNITLPEHADDMSVNVAGFEKYSGWTTINAWDNLQEEWPLQIDSDVLQDFTCIRVLLSAWGSGYAPAYEYVFIPIVDSVDSTKAVLEFADKESGSDVMIDETVNFHVYEKNGREIDQVCLYDGLAEYPTTYTALKTGDNLIATENAEITDYILNAPAGSTLTVTVEYTYEGGVQEGWIVGGIGVDGTWNVSEGFESFSEIVPEIGDVLSFTFDVDEIIQASTGEIYLNYFNGFEIQSAVLTVTEDVDGCSIRKSYYEEQIGDHTVYAQVKYTDSDEWVGINPLTFAVDSYGQTGEFQFTTNAITVTRGELVQLAFTQSANADDYSAGLYRIVDDEPQYIGVGFIVDSENLFVELETVFLEPGDYYLSVASKSSGWRVNQTQTVTITVEEATVVVFDLNAEEIEQGVYELPIGKTLTASVYVPGAYYAEYAIDDEHAGWDCNGQVFGLRTWDEKNIGEEHTITLYANMGTGELEECGSKTIRIVSYGELQLDAINIPDIIGENEQVTFTVPLPGNASNLDVDLEFYIVSNDGFLYPDEQTAGKYMQWTEDGVIVTIPADAVVRNRIILVDCRVTGEEGYPDAEAGYMIPVMPEGSSSVATLALEGGDENNQVLLHQRVKWIVSSNSEDLISDITYFGKIGTQSERESWPTSSLTTSWETDYHEDSVGEKCTMCAMVRLEGSDDFVPTNIISFDVVSNGPVGEFGFTGTTEVTVQQGQFTEFAFENADNASDYRIDLFDEYGTWFDVGETCNGNTVIVSTIGLPVGTYTVCGRANGGLGYEGRDAYNTGVLNVTETTELVYFGASNLNPATLEQVLVSCRIEGAAGICLVQDDRDDDSNTWFTDSAWLPVSWGDPGEHTLTLYAQYAEDAEWEYYNSITLLVHADNGPVVINTDDIPKSITAGSDPVELFIPWDETYGYMGYDVQIHDQEGWFVDSEWCDNTEGGNASILISSECLVAGYSIDLHVWAGGYNYASTEVFMKIPVVPGEVSNDLTLSLEEGQTSQVLINDDTVLVIDGVNYNVADVLIWAGAHDGYRHCDRGYNDDGSRLLLWYWYENECAGENNEVFALIRFSDTNEYVMTNSVNLSVGKDGKTGEFDFAVHAEYEAIRGELVYFSFTLSDNATHYWVDAFDENGGSYNPYNVGYGTSVTMSTAELPEGQYKIYGRAGGEAGWEWTESDSCVVLTVTEPEDGIHMVLNRNEVLTTDIIITSIVAPGASAVGIVVDDSEYIDRISYGVSESFDLSWNESGKHTLCPCACYDGDWEYGEKVEITVVAPGGFLTIDTDDVPETITEGSESVTFTIPWDEQYGYLGCDLRCFDQFRSFIDDRRYDNTEGSNLEITIPAQWCVSGYSIELGIWAGGSGYEHTDVRISVPVVPASTGDPEVTLALAEGFESSSICINQDITFVLTVAGERSIDLAMLWASDYYDQRGCWLDGSDYLYRYRFDNDTAGNHYNVFALVRFTGSTDYVMTNTIGLDVISTGKTGEFDFDGPSEVTVTRGDFVSFTFTPSENATEYWVDAFDVFDGNRNPQSTFEGTTVTMSTTDLNAGQYTIRGRAGNGAGWVWTESTHGVTLNVIEPEDGTVLISTDKTELLTCENALVSVYAPGAVKIGLVFDGNYDDMVQYERNVWYGSAGTQYYNWNEPGEHKIEVYVQYADSTDWILKGEEEFDVTDPYGETPIDTQNVPKQITAGEECAFTIPWKDGIYDYLGYEVRVSDPNGNSDYFVRRDNTEGSNAVISIPAEYIKTGFTVELGVWACGIGYKHGDYHVSIPIMPDASEEPEVTLSLAEVTPNNQVYINTDIPFIITFEGDRTVEDVRVWADNWEFPRNAYQENNSYRFWYCFGNDCEEKEYRIFADVRFSDSSEYVMTNVINVSVGKLGTTGEFDFTDTSERTVARGEFVEFEFTPSENAVDYWVDAFDKDGRYYGLMSTSDGTVVTASTALLPVGQYTIYGRAGGGEGWQWTESKSCVILNVTESTGNDIQLTATKTAVQTMEHVTAVVYAPGALEVKVLVDGSNIDMRWSDTEAMTADWSWNAPGEHELVAYAFYGNDWVPGDHITVTVTADKGNVVLDTSDVPDYLTAGDTDISFTIPWAEDLDYLGYELRYRDEYGNLVDVDRCDNTNGNDVAIQISDDFIIAGYTIELNVWTCGLGYQHTDYHFTIPVIAPASNEVTLSIEPTETGTYLRNTKYKVNISVTNATYVELYNGSNTFEVYSYKEGDDIPVSHEVDMEFPDTGTLTIYANAWVNGEKITSNPIPVTVTTNGEAPTTEVVAPEYVLSGTDAEIQIAVPGDNLWYHVSVRLHDNPFEFVEYQYGETVGENQPYTVIYGEEFTTIVIKADELLPDALYDVEVLFDANGGCAMTGVWKSFRVVEPYVTITTPKRQRTYGETVPFTIDAPLATSVKLYKGEVELDSFEWVADTFGDNIEFTAVAEFEGLDEPLTSSITIDVASLGNAPAPTLEVAETVLSGDTLNISVAAEEGVWFALKVWQGETLVLDGSYDEVQPFSLTAGDPADGNYDIHLAYGKLGYNSIEITRTVEIIPAYTVTWLDGDGNELKSDQVAAGETPVYTGETPTKTATEQYTYTFNNTWTPEIEEVTGEATYTAGFTAVPVEYTITFVSTDGETTTTVATITQGYGTVITPPAEVPVRAGFIFQGWGTELPETMPDHDMTISAVWEMEPLYMTSANVEFKGLIRMRMAFLMTEDLHSRDDVYVAYYKADGTIAAKIPLKDGEYLKDQDGLKSYGYYCPVRAKEFADNLYIKVIGVDGNPVEYSLSSGSWSGTEYVYTTKMYADAVLASSTIRQTMKDVATAFLDYGAAANIRFANGSAGYSVSDKVTQVTWEEMGESASYDSDKAKAMGVKISLNLDFLEDNSLYVYFTLPSGKTVSDYTFTFKRNGTSNTVTPIAQGGNKYLVKVGNIAARKLAEFYDITITEKSNSANTFTVHVSALSYAKTLAQQYEGTTDPTKQKMLNLVKSLYLYWKAAAAHWGTN